MFYHGKQLKELTINEKETNLPFLRLKFELALNDLKQNKAPEVDNITVALLQCASMMIKDTLYQVTWYTYL